MAEFMDLQSNDDAPIRRREKGLYSDPIEYLRRLSSIEQDLFTIVLFLGLIRS